MVSRKKGIIKKLVPVYCGNKDCDSERFIIYNINDKKLLFSCERCGTIYKEIERERVYTHTKRKKNHDA